MICDLFLCHFQTKKELEALFAIIQQQKNELQKLVPLLLQDTQVNPVWKTSHVSAPTFFENKTGKYRVVIDYIVEKKNNKNNNLFYAF